MAQPSPSAFDTDLKWQPGLSYQQTTQMYGFLKRAEETYGLTLPDYKALHRWSVEHKEDFWSLVWDYCGVIGDKGARIYHPSDRFQDSRFFPDGQLNFAENLLRRRDDAVALIFKGEDKVERQITFGQLYAAVSQMRQVLQQAGVKKGDRVAGYMPNMPETIIAMLAAASLGAIWSSASPDFGVQGVLDRFGQIEPKVLFTVDGYYYNGKEIDCRAKVKDVLAQLDSVEKTIVVPYLDLPLDGMPVTLWGDCIRDVSAQDIEFEKFPFDHPLYIMFSSGTTGVPKCIVHGAGGTLIQHLKELKLHCDVKKDDKVFYFTTCGWMMWNWLVSGLSCNAALMLYDGSPFYPDGETLFAYAEKYRCTLFGTAAKFIDALRSDGYRIKDEYDLHTVRIMTSTGSPLVHESFDYIYNAIHPDVHLASISGGTDIVSCFVLGNPLSPVWRGEIQGAGLGMDVDVFDEQGHSVAEGKGELVCKAPFPCMPVGFWRDEDGAKYNAAYFERFDNVWCHGDWCEWTPHGGLIIHGRSDATLNPGGVRIGTAEIYRVVEQLPEIKESIVVGQDWEGDVRVVLFVVLQEGHKLDADLMDRIRKAVREGASPRHMPARIVAVTDIPRTKSGKITELAVRDVIHGRKVKNVEALANPDALKLYENLKELEK